MVVAALRNAECCLTAIYWQVIPRFCWGNEIGRLEWTIRAFLANGEALGAAPKTLQLHQHSKRLHRWQVFEEQQALGWSDHWNHGFSRSSSGGTNFLCRWFRPTKHATWDLMKRGVLPMLVSSFQRFWDAQVLEAKQRWEWGSCCLCITFCVSQFLVSFVVFVYTSYMAYMFVDDLMYLTSNILIVGVRARGSFPLSPSIEVLSLNLSLASYVFIMRVANNPSSIGGIQHLVDTEWCFHGFHGGVKGRAIFRLHSIFRTLEPQTTSDQRLLLQKANLVHQQVVVSSVNFINWNLPIHTSMYLASLGRFASAICDVPYALRGCFERSCHHESPIVLAKWE